MSEERSPGQNTDRPAPVAEPRFIPCSFCPGLEIIGLQSEIRRKGKTQKSDRFETKTSCWTGQPPPHTLTPGPSSVLTYMWRGTVLGAGHSGNSQGHQAMNVVRAGRRVSSTVSQCRQSPHLLVVFTSQTTPLKRLTLLPGTYRVVVRTRYEKNAYEAFGSVPGTWCAEMKPKWAGLGSFPVCGP